jgi:hypothetical protein
MMAGSVMRQPHNDADAVRSMMEHTDVLMLPTAIVRMIREARYLRTEECATLAAQYAGSHGERIAIDIRSLPE